MRDRTPATPNPDDLPPINLGDGDDPALNADADDSIQNARLKPFDYGGPSAAPDATARAIDAAGSKFSTASDKWEAGVATMSAELEKLTEAILRSTRNASAEGQVASPREYSTRNASAEGSAAAAPSPQSTDPTFKSPSFVPGRETQKDSVNAVLRPGEFVMRNEAVKAIGVRNLEKMNSQVQREPHATGGRAGDRFAREQVRGQEIPKSDPQKHFAAGGIATPSLDAAASAPRDIGNSAVRVLGSAVEGGQRGGEAGAIVYAAAQAVFEGAKGVKAAFLAVEASAEVFSERLGAYSGEITSANAKAEMRQTLGDVNRASVIGKDVGRYTESTSKMSQSTQDLEAALTRAGLAVVNPILELLEPMNQFITQVLEHALANQINKVAGILNWLDGVGEGPLVKELKQAAKDIRKIAEQGQEDLKGLDIDQFMNQFLAGHGMGDDANAAKFGNVKRGKPAPPVNRHALGNGIPDIPGLGFGAQRRM